MYKLFISFLFWDSQNILHINIPVSNLLAITPLWLKVHSIAATFIIILLCSIIFLYIRLHAQKYKQALKDREAALKTEELNKKYRLVLRANHATVWRWDIKSDMIDCECEECREKNSEKYQHYSLSGADFYARIHPDDLDRIKKTYQSLKEGRIKMFREEFRYQYQRYSMDYNWVESFAIVGESDFEDNMFILVGGIVVITERKRIEQEAQEKRQAEEANRMKSAFLSSIRHEIRTPLNAIVGFSNLIIQGCNPEEADEYSKIVQQNSSLLVQLIDDVLDMSDIETEEMKFFYSYVDISEMLQLLVKEYRPRVHENVTLSCQLPARSCFAYVDGNRISQVLKSFLFNASKFTTYGSIRIGMEVADNELYFYVSDTGKGISKDDLPRIFDKFVKFDSFIQGAGLGLALSQKLVHKMHGEIGVNSEMGQGSTFWFTIPCKLQTVDGGEVLYANRVTEEAYA